MVLNGNDDEKKYINNNNNKDKNRRQEKIHINDIKIKKHRNNPGE